MVVKKAAAAADAKAEKVAPGFEGGEPLTLANSRGLKSALKFFVKIGLFLEFRRVPPCAIQSHFTARRRQTHRERDVSPSHRHPW